MGHVVGQGSKSVTIVISAVSHALHAQTRPIATDVAGAWFVCSTKTAEPIESRFGVTHGRGKHMLHGV